MTRQAEPLLLLLGLLLSLGRRLLCLGAVSQRFVAYPWAVQTDPMLKAELVVHEWKLPLN